VSKSFEALDRFFLFSTHVVHTITIVKRINHDIVTANLFLETPEETFIPIPYDKGLSGGEDSTPPLVDKNRQFYAHRRPLPQYPFDRRLGGSQNLCK
jgi:hypothetical protein